MRSIAARNGRSTAITSNRGGTSVYNREARPASCTVSVKGRPSWRVGRVVSEKKQEIWINYLKDANLVAKLMNAEPQQILYEGARSGSSFHVPNHSTRSPCYKGRFLQKKKKLPYKISIIET